MSRSATSAPASFKRRAVAAPIAPAAPVTTRHLAGQRLLRRLAELRLLQRPVFHVEEFGFADSDSNRPIASASVIVATAFSAMSAAIAASFLLRPQPEQPEPRHQDDARQRIEHALRRLARGVIAGEIGLIVAR